MHRLIFSTTLARSVRILASGVCVGGIEGAAAGLLDANSLISAIFYDYCLVCMYRWSLEAFANSVEMPVEDRVKKACDYDSLLLSIMDHYYVIEPSLTQMCFFVSLRICRVGRRKTKTVVVAARLKLCLAKFETPAFFVRRMKWI